MILSNSNLVYDIADVLRMDLYVSDSLAGVVKGETLLNLKVSQSVLPTKVVVVGYKENNEGTDGAVIVKVQGSLYFLVHLSLVEHTTTVVVLNGGKLKFNSKTNLTPSTHALPMLLEIYKDGVVEVHKNNKFSSHKGWVKVC